VTPHRTPGQRAHQRRDAINGLGLHAAAQQRLAQARERLQLSPEQENRLRALMQQEGQKLRVIRDKYAGDTSLRARGARSREARAVQEDFRAQLQDLLSPAQLDEWDRMAAEARAQARERRQQQPR